MAGAVTGCCIICGADMAGRRRNANTCSPDCKVAARRARQRAYRAANIEKCREYGREWARKSRAVNPEKHRETLRKAKTARRAALLAVQDILGIRAPKRVGARKPGPVKPIDHDLLRLRDRDRICLCCGEDIGHRPPRVKICTSPDCRRERARIRAAEYRWNNIEMVREKERAKAARDPNNKMRAKAWNEAHRQEAIKRKRRYYASNRTAILEQRHDAYAHEMAALSVIRELQPEGASNEARKAE